MNTGDSQPLPRLLGACPLLLPALALAIWLGSPAAVGATGGIVRPAAGVLLIAKPQLLDPNFRETVVLLVEHDDGGALGVIVNRPTEVRLPTLLPEVEGIEADPLYFGGPVAIDQILLLVRGESEPEGAQHVVDDVWVSGSRELLESLARQEGSVYRLYSGYAGWAPGQLDHEISRGDWRLVPADGDTVFSDAVPDLWRELLRRTADRWAAQRAPASEPSAAP